MLHIYADVTGSYEGQANGLFQHGTGLQEGWVGHGHTAEILSASATTNSFIEVGKEYFVSYREDTGGRTEVSLEVLGRQGYNQYSTAEKKVIDAIRVDLKFKQRHIVMPQDCIEVLGVGLRERGSGIRSPFYVLPKYFDENMALDLDLVALPTDIIITKPVSIQQPIDPPQLETITPVPLHLCEPGNPDHQIVSRAEEPKKVFQFSPFPGSSACLRISGP